MLASDKIASWSVRIPRNWRTRFLMIMLQFLVLLFWNSSVNDNEHDDDEGVSYETNTVKLYVTLVVQYTCLYAYQASNPSSFYNCCPPLQSSVTTSYVPEILWQWKSTPVYMQFIRNLVMNDCGPNNLRCIIYTTIPFYIRMYPKSPDGV